MKEYEYIVLVTDEVFSHMISSVICLENYFNESIDNSFRKIFTMFNEIRKDFKQNFQQDVGIIDESLEIAKFKIKCRSKREEILQGYIEELKEIDPSIDYLQQTREYYDRIEKEDVETLEMQLMVYPYLLSLIRKKEENKESLGDGEKSC